MCHVPLRQATHDKSMHYDGTRMRGVVLKRRAVPDQRCAVGCAVVDLLPVEQPNGLMLYRWVHPDAMGRPTDRTKLQVTAGNGAVGKRQLRS